MWSLPFYWIRRVRWVWLLYALLVWVFLELFKSKLFSWLGGFISARQGLQMLSWILVHPQVTWLIIPAVFLILAAKAVYDVRKSAGSAYIYGTAVQIATLGKNIQGRTFEDCVILGPAVLFLVPGTGYLDANCSARGDLENIFLDVSGDPSTVQGFIHVQDCTFRGCNFRHISFSGSPEYIQRMRGTLTVRP